MSETSKIIDEKIKNGDLNFDVKPPKPKNKSILRRIVTWPFRMMLAMLGIDLELLKESSTSHGGHHHGPGGFHPHPTGAEFRESHKVSHSPFSPYGFNPVEAENLAIYLRSSDGKGDPEPHDCDHEH